MMPLRQLIPGMPRPRPVRAKQVCGVVLEVADLDATQEFYNEVFRAAGGTWERGHRGGTLTFHAAGETVQFVQRARPRVSDDAGAHHAYRVGVRRVHAVAERLAACGARVDWWHEDHPCERNVTPYVRDPSGHRVQLVEEAPARGLIQHVALVVHELLPPEEFYVSGFGGRADYYHGREMVHYEEARRYGDGNDPCAPWTRLSNNEYVQHRGFTGPNMQLFVRFGPSLLGLIMGLRHFQEPPEGQLRGTPRIVFRTSQTAVEAATYLAMLGLYVERSGRSIFTRDPSGNFVELRADT